MESLKTAYAWQEALELSGRLVDLCEEFSDATTNVLVWHLRQAVVDVPAGIAADLHLNRPATLEPAVKLLAELELVHRIYPAIDVAPAENQLTVLLRRMQSDQFAEREPEPSDELETETAHSGQGREDEQTTQIQVDHQDDTNQEWRG